LITIEDAAVGESVAFSAPGFITIEDAACEMKGGGGVAASLLPPDDIRPSLCVAALTSLPGSVGVEEAHCCDKPGSGTRRAEIGSAATGSRGAGTFETNEFIRTPVPFSPGWLVTACCSKREDALAMYEVYDTWFVKLRAVVCEVRVAPEPTGSTIIIGSCR
jgi:hypothetical protein